LCPHAIAIAFDHSVRAANTKRFVGIERGVDTAEHNVGASLARDLANFIATQRVSGVNTDSDNVAWLKLQGVALFQRLINQNWVAKAAGSSPRQHIEPTWRDDRGPERCVAGINQVNFCGACLNLTFSG
jgi:hypothetical protein